MMMLLLPPAALLALVLALKTRRWFAIAALITIALAYAAALALISHDPYFDDNGSREFIEWRFRLVLAAEVGGWFSLPLLPLVYASRAVCRRIARAAGRGSSDAA